MKNAGTPLPLGVVTVTYSPGQHLPALVESLSANTEIILADNGSTDGSPQAVAEAYDNVHFLPTGGNIGYGAAANRGIAELARMRADGLIRGDVVLLVNPDVTFAEGAIDALLECASANPDAGSVGPLIRENDGSVYPSARAVPTLIGGTGHAVLSGVWPNNPFSRRYHGDSAMDRQRDAGWLSGSCLLLNWAAFDEIGGFDERYFMYMEDVDLGDRLGRAGWRNIFCPAAEIHHDQGHSAKKFKARTIRAHHESAYRFNADRAPGWRWAPLRWGLRAGLALRASILLGLARRRNEL
ncbi:glycosyltransferase family 2 protein [Corynebacterium sp. TAE3-ERU12]|uniref:glycosyltransferase family 2 protein n=1 Tax=Corynebacterium sp. TAE3-ERU12 TaxID=2849491 RepID=UPI00351CE4AE